MNQVAEPTLFPTEGYAIGGPIKKLTPDGRVAFVELDHSIEGVKYAVVGDECQGRVNLMNKNLFKVGSRVKILEYTPGSEALIAKRVEPENDA